MHDDNERNEKNYRNEENEQDVDYTEASYSDSTYDGEKEKKSENSDYGGYHDSRYRGSVESDDEYVEVNQDNDPDESAGHESDSDGHGTHGHGSRNTGRKIAAIVMSGVLFGCVAGTTMVGVNRFSVRLFPEESVQETVADASSDTQTDVTTTSQASTGNDVSAIVEKAMPSVVAINNTMVYTQNNWLFGKQQYEVPSSGSGIIAGQNDTELLIITNNHVVEDSEELSVTFIDNQSVKAAVKGTDSDSDLAVIAVQLSDIPDETKKEIKAADLGDSDSLKLGQGVVAIGNALGQGQSVTVGYVSALNKKVTIEGVERTLLQVDAAINPGNSGGALLNMNGEVIGINAAKYSDTSVEGIGYAIPISQARDIIGDLMTKTTKVEVAEDEQGYLGIQLQNIDSQMAKAYDMPEGIYVYKIVDGGAASKSDLRERDIITKFDGEKVKNGDELKKLLTYYKAGSTVTMTVQSLENGSYVEREVQITLGSKSDMPQSQDTQNSQNKTQASPQRKIGR